MTASIAVEGKGPVRTIRLGRPPINALDAEALEELAAAADAVSEDAECKVVVFASALDGIFCSGGDLKFWRSFPRERAREVTLAGRETFARIACLQKPTLAAIDGHVIGDGIALALSCDLRFASSRAVFRLPEAAYGFIPGWGTLHHLTRAVGRPRTLDMVLTGRTVDAGTALAWELVNRLQRAEALAEGLEALVDALLSMSPAALSLAKAALAEGPGVPDGTPERETAAFLQAWGGEDWDEGIAALLAKRPPRFGLEWPPRAGATSTPDGARGGAYDPHP